MTVVNRPEGYTDWTDSPSFIVNTHRVTANEGGGERWGGKKGNNIVKECLVTSS